MLADRPPCSNMVDIFEITQPGPGMTGRAAPAPYPLAGQQARLARYRSLLSKFSVENDDDVLIEATWAEAHSEGGTKEGQQVHGQCDQNASPPVVKLEAHEPLVGNFADAARAAART